MLSSVSERVIRLLLTPAVLASRWGIPRGGRDHRDLPVPHASPGLTAKMMADELFFLSEFALAKHLSMRDRHRVGSEVAAALELYEAHGWLSAPERYLGTPPPLHAARLCHKECGRWRFQALSFDSAYEPYRAEPGRDRWLSYVPNRTAHAWVLEHRGRPRPWLLCIPGYRMGSPRIDFRGLSSDWLYTRWGLNVAIPVLPFHGPRAIARRSGDGFLTGDPLDTVHAVAQAVWDIRRILSWLRSRHAPGIGLYGVSLGGYLAALIASVEADLGCVIAGIPVVDFSHLAHCHLPPPVLWVAERLGLVSDEIEQLMRVISPLALAPRLPRERRFLFAGLADRLVPPDHVRKLWRHWGCPRLEWYAGGHLSFLWATEVRALIHEALAVSGLLPTPRRRAAAVVALPAPAIAA